MHSRNKSGYTHRGAKQDEKQPAQNGDVAVSATGHGFFGNLLENIRLAGGSPTHLGGFIAAWVAFFLILYVIPMPEITAPTVR